MTLYSWPADWTTPRRGANVAGNRYVCPTLAPNPVHEDPTLPECFDVTQCTRCWVWICPEHGGEDYVECDSGVLCRDCHESHACPDLFCRDDVN